MSGDGQFRHNALPMFTYLDPAVRARLVAEGKLVRVDQDGQRLGPNDSSGGKAISILGPIPLPLELGARHVDVEWFACVRNTELSKVQELADQMREQHTQQLFANLASSMAVNCVLTIGDRQSWTNPLIRVHSSCLTGDVFGSQRCECGPQLQHAIATIQDDEQGGMLVYMSGHEGRGIGLWAKAATYILQDAGENTYQANRSLGLPDDSRDFSDAATLIRHFYGNGPFRLLTNNPKKVTDLTEHGLEQITPVKHVIGVSDSNRAYLEAKKGWGHKIDPDDIN
jgi:GTP cyclohydrolase II